jgi:lysophospholipase L1-like esterase
MTRGSLRYVALGDSYSAGLPDDPHPPWPELVAGELRRSAPELDFHNLAAMGATTREVLDTQVPTAIRLRPDVVTVVCGVNDVLLSLRPDPEAFRVALLEIVTELGRASGPPIVVLATLADVSRFVPFRPRSRARVARGIAAFNAVVREVVARHGCPLVDVARAPGSSDPTSYGPDGIHATLAGHTRMAEGTFEVIGQALWPDAVESGGVRG